MKSILLALILIVLCFGSFRPVDSRKIMLVILAHADDETAIGAMMAKFARNNTVYYIVATDG